MPEYEKYGFKNSVVDRLINRPVFNANTNEGGTERSSVKSYASTLNVPVEKTRTNLGDNSAMTYLAGAGAQGVKALIKYAAKKLAKKGAIKGASSLTEK